MPSGRQIRAARALLGISAAELAELAGITHRTIQRYEAIDGVSERRGAALDRVEATLVAHGVEFIGDPESSPGVQLKPKRARKRKQPRR